MPLHTASHCPGRGGAVNLRLCLRQSAMLSATAKVKNDFYIYNIYRKSDAKKLKRVSSLKIPNFRYCTKGWADVILHQNYKRLAKIKRYQFTLIIVILLSNHQINFWELLAKLFFCKRHCRGPD